MDRVPSLSDLLEWAPSEAARQVLLNPPRRRLIVVPPPRTVDLAKRERYTAREVASMLRFTERQIRYIFAVELAGQTTEPKTIGREAVLAFLKQKVDEHPMPNLNRVLGLRKLNIR